MRCLRSIYKFSDFKIAKVPDGYGTQRKIHNKLCKILYQKQNFNERKKNFFNNKKIQIFSYIYRKKNYFFRSYILILRIKSLLNSLLCKCCKYFFLPWIFFLLNVKVSLHFLYFFAIYTVF